MKEVRGLICLCLRERGYRHRRRLPSDNCNANQHRQYRIGSDLHTFFSERRPGLEECIYAIRMMVSLTDTHNESCRFCDLWTTRIGDDFQSQCMGSNLNAFVHEDK